MISNFILALVTCCWLKLLSASVNHVFGREVCSGGSLTFSGLGCGAATVELCVFKAQKRFDFEFIYKFVSVFLGQKSKVQLKRMFLIFV